MLAALTGLLVYTAMISLLDLAFLQRLGALLRLRAAATQSVSPGKLTQS
jgi:hypothetical protein